MTLSTENKGTTEILSSAIVYEAKQQQRFLWKFVFHIWLNFIIIAMVFRFSPSKSSNYFIMHDKTQQPLGQSLTQLQRKLFFKVSIV